MNFAKEIKDLPSILRRSAKEMHRVSSLCGTAMLTALNVAVGALSIPVSPTLRIGFSSIPAAVCGMYYGPVCTGIAGVIADTLKYIVRPDGPYFPGFALNEFLVGFIYGCFFYKKKITLLRVILARACITILINLILTSLWLNIMYQNPLFTTVRLIKNIVMFPVDAALLYAALKGAERVKQA